MAISGWRRLVFLRDYADSVVAEGTYASLKTDADRLMAALKDQGLLDTNINEQTQKRYLALGKRVQLHKSLLMRWELYHARDSLVDHMTTMRCICSVCDREEDVAYVLNQLFLQQRAGLRNSLIVPKVQEWCENTNERGQEHPGRADGAEPFDREMSQPEANLAAIR